MSPTRVLLIYQVSLAVPDTRENPPAMSVCQRSVPSFLFIFAAGLLGFAFPVEADEWSPPPTFPNVAVAKVDENGDMQLLIPVREFEIVDYPQSYMIQVPVTETVDGVEKQSYRTETLERLVKVHICKNTFKMVRMSVPGDSVEATDTSGFPLTPDILKQRLSQAGFIVLCGAEPATFISGMLREDALLLSFKNVDPDFNSFPAVMGLQKKWTRTETTLTPAVAQHDPKSDRVIVTTMKLSQRLEDRTRMVTSASGNEVEQPYKVQVRYRETIQNAIDLNECEIQTVSGNRVTVAEARKKLAEPCRIFFDSQPAEYLGSVLNPDVLVVRQKNSDRDPESPTDHPLAR